jgi:hypothetical protein
MKLLILGITFFSFVPVLSSSRSLNAADLGKMDKELLKLIISCYQKTGEYPNLTADTKIGEKPSRKKSEKSNTHEKKQDKKEEKKSEEATFVQVATGVLGGFANVVAGSVTGNAGQVINGAGGMFSSFMQAITHRSPRISLREKNQNETSPSVARK